MAGEPVSAITRVSERLSFPGYVFDEESLIRVDAIAAGAVATSATAQEEMRFAASVEIMGENQRHQFTSLVSLLEHFRSERHRMRRLELLYQVANHAGINVAFEANGHIGLSAYSDRIDFQFNLDRLRHEIDTCRQDYSWLVRVTVFWPRLPRFVALGILLLSANVLLNVTWWWSAMKIGVNIDPKFIQRGNTYYQEVERALSSDSIATKVDILLRGQLRGFVNAADFLADRQWQIISGLIGIGLLGLLLLLIRKLRGIYPLAFFAIGREKDVLVTFRRRREVWGTAVFLAFLVNIVAGIVVAFITR